MNISPETRLIRYRRICILALYALCFMAPLGALSRFWSTSEASVEAGLNLIPGPTTVIIVLMVAYGFLCQSVPRLIFRQKVWVLFFAFVGVTVFAAVFQLDAMNGCIRSAMFSVYALLMLFIVNLGLNERQMLNAVLCAACGMLLMLSLSIIDYYNIANVPLVNLRSFSLSIEGAGEGVSMRSLSGPFRSRSELSAFLSVLIPPCLGCALLNGVSWWKRLIFIAAVGVGAFAVLVSASRAMYLALAVSLAYILFCFLKGGRHAGRIVFISMLGVVAGGLVLLLNRDYYLMMVGRLSDLSIEHISYAEGDMVRLYALEETLKEMVTKPWGMGFTQVVLMGRSWDVHSIFTEFIRAGGVIGMFIIVAFVVGVRKMARQAEANHLRFIFFSALVGCLVYNIAHSYWQVSVLWVLMGFYFTLLSRRRRAASYHERW